MGVAPKFLLQYARLRRRHADLRELLDRSGEKREDAAQAFFQDCLHLRDWIVNDSSLSPAIRDAVSKHVRSDQHLSLCRDLAVGAKHLRVDRPLTNQSPIVEEAFFTGSVFETTEGELGENYSDRLGVITADKVIDLAEFADACMLAWSHFFRHHGLKAIGEE